MLSQTTIKNIRTVNERFPDSDGWYTEAVTYGDVTCPKCGRVRRYNLYYVGNGDGDTCDFCKTEYTIIRK